MAVSSTSRRLWRVPRGARETDSSRGRGPFIEEIAREAAEWRRELHRHPQTMYEETFASRFRAAL